MKIVQVMAGYSLGQADNIRRIMGKKKVEKIAAEKVKFIDGYEDPTGKHSIPGAVKLGHDRAVAEKIFDRMAEFAKYAFNKSHAAAYGYVSYQTAYLKCYYEVELLTAVLNNRISNADQIKTYTTLAKKEGFEILPPDINHSYTYFKVENGNIRFGLAALKNVGTAVIDEIVKEREANGPFKSFEDYCSRVSMQALNKRTLESLILGGAFDCFGKYRSQLMAVFTIAVERVSKDIKNANIGQFTMFDGENAVDEKFNSLDYPNIKEFNRETLLKREKEVVGIYLSGHPLDEYLDKYDDFNLTSDMLKPAEDEDKPMDDEYEDGQEEAVFDQVQDGQNVVCGGIIVEISKKLKNNKEMCFIKIEDLYGTIEVAFFGRVYTKYKTLIEEDKLVTIKGKISLRNGMASVIADEIFHWKKEEEVQVQTTNKKLYLRFDTKNIDVYNKVMKTLQSYLGDCGVIIKCTTANKAYALNVSVDPNNYLINELYGIVGTENVVLKG
jgi:DNA polymerase-3 subunit alpha